MKEILLTLLMAIITATAQASEMDSLYAPVRIWNCSERANTDDFPLKDRDILHRRDLRQPAKDVLLYQAGHSLKIAVLPSETVAEFFLTDDEGTILWISTIGVGDTLTLPSDMAGIYTLWIRSVDGYFYGYINLD